jgi:hypothetical protein
MKTKIYSLFAILTLSVSAWSQGVGVNETGANVMKRIFMLLLLFLNHLSIAQIGIGTTDPKATLDIQGSPTIDSISDGVIAPRITGDQLQSKTYTAEHVGALLYVTEEPTSPSGQVADVNAPGYYYFDGTVWKQFGSLYTAAFNDYIVNTNSVNLSSTHTVVLTYTIPSSGLYEVDALLDYTLANNQPIRYYLAKNGILIGLEREGYQTTPSAATGTIVFTPGHTKAVASFSAGDIITLRAYAHFGTSTINRSELFIKKIAGLLPMTNPSINNGNNIFGDVKSGFQENDHDGWILLNGRDINLLSPTQQLIAAQLGFTTTIPNANSAYLVQNQTGLGTLSSSNLKAITRENLPNESITLTTTSNGAHSHAFDTKNSGTGSQGVIRNSNSATQTLTNTTNSTGAHTHTVTFNLNGNVTQQSFDVRPRSLSVNMFVFLGL